MKKYEIWTTYENGTWISRRVPKTGCGGLFLILGVILYGIMTLYNMLYIFEPSEKARELDKNYNLKHAYRAAQDYNINQKVSELERKGYKKDDLKIREREIFWNDNKLKTEYIGNNSYKVTAEMDIFLNGNDVRLVESRFTAIVKMERNIVFKKWNVIELKFEK